MATAIVMTAALTQDGVIGNLPGSCPGVGCSNQPPATERVHGAPTPSYGRLWHLVSGTKLYSRLIRFDSETRSLTVTGQ